jgi:hypothetical protein
MVGVLGGYFVTLIVRDGFWQISDMLVLLIICRITYYQFPRWGEHKRVHEIWTRVCLSLLITLSALALYRVAVTAVYVGLTLNGYPYRFVAQFALEEVKLSAAYQILYLLVSIFILGFTAYYIARRTKLLESLDIVSRNTR